MTDKDIEGNVVEELRQSIKQKKENLRKSVKDLHAAERKLETFEYLIRLIGRDRERAQYDKS